MLLGGATGADILRHPVGDETPIAVRYWQIRRPVKNFLRRLPPARPTPTPAKRRNRQPNFAIYASSLIMNTVRSMKLRIAGLATALQLCSGLGLADLGLVVATATAAADFTQ